VAYRQRAPAGEMALRTWLTGRIRQPHWPRKLVNTSFTPSARLIAMPAG